MNRRLEPELMDEWEQAVAYAEADFAEPHEAFVAHFAARFPEFVRGHVLDLGCGPADMTVRFARAFPAAQITGIDGAAAMLELGRARLTREDLAQRVRLVQLRLPATFSREYDAVISNSLLHHLHDPMVLWDAIRQAARPGAPVCVMDLLRPTDEAAARELVGRYARDAAPVLRRDFYNSLCAAFDPHEVVAQLEACGLDLRVEVVSDRHLLVS